MALSTIEEIQKEPTKLYLDRINELNEIIGQLNKENETLKMNLFFMFFFKTNSSFVNMFL